MNETRQMSREAVEFALEALSVEKGFDRLDRARDLIRDALYDDSVTSLLDKKMIGRLTAAACALDEAITFGRVWWYERTSEATAEMMEEIFDEMEADE